MQRRNFWQHNQQMANWIRKQSHLAILLVTLAVSGGLPAITAAQIDTARPSRPAVNKATELLRQGQEKFQQQDYLGAIADYNQALVINPNDADIYFNRGLVLFQLSDNLGALSDFNDAIVRNSRFARAYFYRAGVRSQLGFQSGAILDLRIAAKLFLEQGDKVSYQKARDLLKQFNADVAP